MTSANLGTFVISWSQTHIDGQKGAPPSSLQVGGVWSWCGALVPILGPLASAANDRTDDHAAYRRQAAHRVRLLVGAAMQEPPAQLRAHGGSTHGIIAPESGGAGKADTGFTVTDGRQSYTVTLIDVPERPRPLLMFAGAAPPPGRDLRVVAVSGAVAERRNASSDAQGIICFAAGTRLLTPRGSVAVESLREGDSVLTKDNGAQPVLWVGSRRMSGARLHVLPELRPVRIEAGAFGIGRPDLALLVSPEHRMLVRGAVAQAMFGHNEVLVAAKHLVNGTSIRRDVISREVTYVHVLLPRHEIVFANGIESESFHPANTALSSLRDDDRARLLGLRPELAARPDLYGAHARRDLSPREAALLVRQAA